MSDLVCVWGGGEEVSRDLPRGVGVTERRVVLILDITEKKTNSKSNSKCSDPVPFINHSLLIENIL